MPSPPETPPERTGFPGDLATHRAVHRIHTAGWRTLDALDAIALLPPLREPSPQQRMVTVTGL